MGKRRLPFLAPTDTDRIYAAGFIDADGCIRVARIGKTFRAEISAAQREPAVLQWLAARWGATVREQVIDGRIYYQWHVVGGMAEALCRDIEPYLIVKTSQAGNLLSFCKSAAPIEGWIGGRLTYAGSGEFEERSRVLNTRQRKGESDG
jgi:hypothetical protein